MTKQILKIARRGMQVKVQMIAAGLLFFAGAVAAQSLPPNLPPRMTFIVPFAASGPVDYAARVLADKMREMTGANIIVDNRPSANGVVAATVVKQAAPTGETILFASSGLLAIAPHMMKKMPFEVLTDFDPIVTTGYADGVLVVNGNVPASNLKEFLQLARSAPKPLAVASAGVGSILQGWLEVFKEEAKVDLIHVPYKGAGPGFADLLSGQVPAMFVGLSLAAPYIATGKLKAIGIIGHKRSELTPDVPTFEEQGVKNLDLLAWTGVLAPKGTKPEIIAAIRDAATRALDQPDVKKKFAAAGISNWVLNSQDFAKEIKRDNERWGKLIDGNPGFAEN